MGPQITAAALRRAFREVDGLEPLVLPDGEVVGSVEADIGPLRAVLVDTAWLRSSGPEAHGVGEVLAVRPSEGVRVNFFLGWGAPIEFDFDLREMVDDEAVDGLVRLLRLVSSTLSKDVVIRPEGQHDVRPVLRVSAATGELTLGPETSATTS